MLTSDLKFQVRLKLRYQSLSLATFGDNFQVQKANSTLKKGWGSEYM